MSNVILNTFKGQRMDITALMKDADVILEAFRAHNVRFDKKFTSINGKGPSTITFKGITASNIHSDITDAIMELHEKATKEEIGNVYVRFTTFQKPFRRNETKTEEVQSAPEDVEEEDATL